MVTFVVFGVLYFSLVFPVDAPLRHSRLLWILRSLAGSSTSYLISSDEEELFKASRENWSLSKPFRNLTNVMT